MKQNNNCLVNINNNMEDTISKLVIKEKGILAIDESNTTIGKRFFDINLENTALNRQRYRSLLATTENLSNYISGVILFEETLTQKLILNLGSVNNNNKQKNDTITNIAEKFIEQNIVVGIKVDQGLMSIYPNQEEKTTKGLDLLIENLPKYQSMGAKFAKWRAVINIEENKKLPSKLAIHINAEQLARYAAICQFYDIVPIVEPEILMDGNHDLEQCAKVTEQVLFKVFKALRKYSVQLEYMILKPNMVLPGKLCKISYSTEDIAKQTLKVLKRTVPAAVPSINFLSGGQSEDEATNNLNAINKLGIAPWHLSFSFGRALQESCLKAWKGNDNNIKEAQKHLLNRARLNSLANLGQKY